MARHGIEVPEGYIQTAGEGDGAGDISGHEAMLRLLSLDPAPTGFSASTIRRLLGR